MAHPGTRFVDKGTPMSTKEPISRQERDGALPGWQLYSEMFDPEHVYLEFEGVAAEITMPGNMERAPGTVLLRLPVATAKQLCLVPESWEGSVAARLANLGGSQPGMKGVSRRRQDPDDTPASPDEG
jgi:hypothetical protein